MGYSQAYYLDCDKQVFSYNSDCCIPTEFGRVGSVAFIKRKYLQQILSDPENSSVWQTGVDNGNIIVLPLTTGTFDSGTPQRLRGFGRRIYTNGNRDMLLNFFVPADKANFEFFDDLNFRSDYVPAFKTESWVHICDTAAHIATKESVEEDVDSSVLWSVECTIRTRKLPIKIDFSAVASIFVCTTVSVTHRILLENADRWLLENGSYWLHE